MIPQREYRSRTSQNAPLNTAGYVEFNTPVGSGFPITDALEDRFVNLIGRDDTDILVGCGASISIRIEVCSRGIT
jgi:hypothetical protein